MTRAEQPAVVTAPANPTYDEALAADSRERAVRALLRTPAAPPVERPVGERHR